jgi:cholesterol transport system auxiliary component
MTLSRGLPSLAAVAALAVGLGGCVTLFPASKPAQLYAFGKAFPAQQQTAAGGTAFHVLRAHTEFNRAAAGDRILTLNGQEAAYIADSRWISPASTLFDEAEVNAFTADDGPAKLSGPGQIAGATAELRLDVGAFEVRYPGSLKAAPTVVVSVHAVLVALPDRHVIAEKTFAVSKPTGDNRVGDIVAAFDAATVDVLSQTAAWTDSQAPATRS